MCGCLKGVRLITSIGYSGLMEVLSISLLEFYNLRIWEREETTNQSRI